MEAGEESAHDQRFTLEAWTAYLTTQSNVIAATGQRGEDALAIADWLQTSLRPHFTHDREVFPFECRLEFFRADA